MMRVLLILLLLGIQPVVAKGLWVLADKKIEEVKDTSNAPAKWVGGNGTVAAEKRWYNSNADFTGFILAVFTWKGVPREIAEGEEYPLFVKIEQKANNETGYDPSIKFYTGVEGGPEVDGPDVSTSWRQSLSTRENSGKLFAPPFSGQAMYLRVQCKVAGDYFNVRYTYRFQGSGVSGSQPPDRPSQPSRPTQSLFDNFNSGGVRNGPPNSLGLTFQKPVHISQIKTYHYGLNAAPGTLRLVNSQTGRTYGPWATQGLEGQGGIPNAFWLASPEQDLPAGNYRLEVSNPSSWSYNDQSGGCGFAAVRGYSTR